MTAPNDRVLERVRKLLATAEHPNTPPAEAEAMSEKAAELMARHAIDRALVEQHEPRHAPQRRDIVVPAPYSLPKSVLLSTLAESYRVAVVVRGEIDSGRTCTMIGFDSDLAVVELLFTSLLLQATSAMLGASAGHPRTRAFRRAFLFGYANAIGERIRAVGKRTEDEARSTGASTAVVLADRKAEVDRAVAELFPRLGRIRTTISDGGGVVAGQAAGRRADLGAARRRVGGSRRELA